MSSPRLDHTVRLDVATTFFGLLRGSYEFQEGVLYRISAFDAAKLDASFNGFLFHPCGPVADSQRDHCLNPIRDLFWDAAGVVRLLQEGLRLILLGPDVHTLKRRLHDTMQDKGKSNNGRKLRIYLVGVFPIRGKSTPTLDSMIRLSVAGTPKAGRILTDSSQLRRLQQAMLLTPGVEKAFVMAFGAPKDIRVEQQKSFWYRARDLPDSTIDLRVYVPSFRDRERERISFSFGSFANLLGLVPGNATLDVISDSLLKLCNGVPLVENRLLTDAGIRAVDCATQRELAVKFQRLLPYLSLAC